MGKILLGIALGIGGVFIFAVLTANPYRGRTASGPIESDEPCPTSSITIKSIRTEWIDECSTRSCAYMRGAGGLINTCPIAVGIELKMTGYDKSGMPIASKSGWPASIKNVPPGNYVFSLNHWLDYDPAIKRLEVTVESTRIWH